MRAVFSIIGLLMILGGFGYAIATPESGSPDPTLGVIVGAMGFFVLITALTVGRGSSGYRDDDYDGSPRRWRSTRRRSSGSSRSSGGSWSSFGGSSGGSSGGFSGFGRSSSRSKSRSSRSSSRSSSRKGGSGRSGGSSRKSR